MTGFTYKSYNFVDKDPIIDEIRTIFESSGATQKWVSDRSGVNVNTLTNWFQGRTKKPQAATINAVLRTLGYKLGIVEFGEKVMIINQPSKEEKPVIKDEDKITSNKIHYLKKWKHSRKRRG